MLFTPNIRTQLEENLVVFDVLRFPSERIQPKHQMSMKLGDKSLAITRLNQSSPKSNKFYVHYV